MMVYRLRMVGGIYSIIHSQIVAEQTYIQGVDERTYIQLLHRGECPSG